MMRTWLPGPKPWGGTTNRALLSIICVPPTSGVEVLMIIFCWTVPAAEVDHGLLAGPAAGIVCCILLRASCELEGKGVLSPLPLWLFKMFSATVGVVDCVCAGILCMVENGRAAVTVPRSFLLLAVGVVVVNVDVEQQS